MNKLLLLSLCCVVCLNVFSQKITKSEVDRFTKKKIIETSFEKVVSDKNLMGSSGGRLMKNIWVGFKAVDSTIFMRVKWCTNQVLALREDAKVILLDKDGGTYTFLNTSLSISGNGEGTVGIWGSALPGLNLYLAGEASQLQGKEITGMRFYTTDGYMDFEVEKKKVSVFSDAYNLVKTELSK